jgi:hypothetical protein
VILLVQYSRLMAAVNLSGDAASGPVIGELFGHGRVTLGHMAWYSTLLFELATRWLPAHLKIWEVAPGFLWLAAAALIGWATARLAGRWAGALSATAVVCAGPDRLSWLLTLNAHAPTWFTLALLAGWIVLLLSTDLGSRMAIALAVLVGAIAGANAASDNTLVFAGIVPFVVVGGLLLRERSTPRVRRALVLMAATLAFAALAALATRLIAGALNVHGEPFNVNTFVTGDGLVTTFRYWFVGIATLGNGGFFGQQVGFTSILELCCAVIAIAAVIATMMLPWRTSSSRAPDGDAVFPLAARAYVVFWGICALILTVAYMLNSQTEPGSVAFDRYIVGEIYAAAAIIPLLVRRPGAWRYAIAAAVVVFAFTGVLSRTQSTLLRSQDHLASPTDQIANEITHKAHAAGLSVGYTGYWDAAPLTLASRFQVKIYPVFTCGATICPYPEHFITSWYTPRPNQRSFLIVDPAEAFVQGAPTGLGRPSAVIPLTTVTMYVYPYDIAARLGSAPCPGC